MRAALPVCDRYGLVLAGGYAIKAHGLVTRPSDDIDFATASAAPMEEITASLAHAYRQAGVNAQVISAEGRKGHVRRPPFRSDVPGGCAQGTAQPSGGDHELWAGARSRGRRGVESRRPP
ncbi:nucleotidyl transferase AbiEii/AbiGii toxin family protein [Planobispora longispora]